MAIIVFGDGAEICISSHLMNAFCHEAKKHTQNEKFLGELRSFRHTGEIDLRDLSRLQCKVFLNGVEDTIRNAQQKGVRSANMINGSESIASDIQKTIKGKTV